MKRKEVCIKLLCEHVEHTCVRACVRASICVHAYMCRKFVSVCVLKKSKKSFSRNLIAPSV